MSPDQPSRSPLQALSFLGRHSLFQLLLGSILLTLALRAAFHIVQVSDMLARIIASLVFFTIPIVRFALPGGLEAAALDFTRGWDHSMRWLALVGWWRLLFFSILTDIGVNCGLHAAFLQYTHEGAFIAIIFSLLAAVVAARIRVPKAATETPAPTTSQPHQAGISQSDTKSPTSLVRIFLIVTAILAALAIGFAAGWSAQFAPHARLSVTDKGVLIQSMDSPHHSVTGNDAQNDDNDDEDTSGKDEAASKDILVVDPNGQRVHVRKSADGKSRDILITDKDGNPQVSVHKQIAPPDDSAPAALPLPAQSARVSAAPENTAPASTVSAPPAAQSVPASAAKPKHKADVDLDLEQDEDKAAKMYFAFLLFLVVCKFMARDKYRAELNAASAWSVADRSMLDREIADAKLAAMQAQIEPHFLFNTLASIDQLIQSDPPRASRLQKSLIQYLRAAIPQIRSDAHRSTLGRQVDMSMAYLEIMQMRMEERLHYEINVADPLRDAEFPSMMLQTLIENAIKHGLEPAPEGGSLIVTATRDDKCLTINVSNTGMNYAPSTKPGSGTGLANIRDRLRLLYGDKGAFTIGAPASGGCLAIISIPYTAQP
jgi:hypothetical protein